MDKLNLFVSALLASISLGAGAQTAGVFDPTIIQDRVGPTPPALFLGADGFIGSFGGGGPQGSYLTVFQDGVGGVWEARFSKPDDLVDGGPAPGAFDAFGSYMLADNSSDTMFSITTGAEVAIADGASSMPGGVGARGLVPVLVHDATSSGPVMVNVGGLLDGSLTHLPVGFGSVSVQGSVMISLGETVLFSENWFAQSTPFFQFGTGFDGGEIAFVPTGATVSAPLSETFSVPNGSVLDIEANIFADGLESGDVSSWGSTLDVTLSANNANPNTTFTVIPEPTSALLLMGTALAVLGRTRRI